MTTYHVLAVIRDDRPGSSMETDGESYTVEAESAEAARQQIEARDYVIRVAEVTEDTGETPPVDEDEAAR